MNTPPVRCKIGDLCWINKALRTTNIGKVVTTKEYLGYFQKGDSFVVSGETWYAVDTGHLWIIESPSGIETQFGTSKEAHILDMWLTPILPDALDIATEDEDTLEYELHNTEELNA